MQTSEGDLEYSSCKELLVLEDSSAIGVAAGWYASINSVSIDLMTDDKTAVSSIISDFALAGFPMLVLKDLQMNMRTKAAICIALGLGAS